MSELGPYEKMSDQEKREYLRERTTPKPQTPREERLAEALRPFAECDPQLISVVKIIRRAPGCAEVLLTAEDFQQAREANGEK